MKRHQNLTLNTKYERPIKKSRKTYKKMEHLKPITPFKFNKYRNTNTKTMKKYLVHSQPKLCELKRKKVEVGVSVHRFWPHKWTSACDECTRIV